MNRLAFAVVAIGGAFALTSAAQNVPPVVTNPIGFAEAIDRS